MSYTPEEDFAKVCEEVGACPASNRLSQGEAAVWLMRNHPDNLGRICWGDLPAMHNIRSLAKLPHRGPRTMGLVLQALGQYAADPATDLVCIGWDYQTKGRHYGLAGLPYQFHRPDLHWVVYAKDGTVARRGEGVKESP